jgi:hypothetical protein
LDVDDYATRNVLLSHVLGEWLAGALAMMITALLRSAKWPGWIRHPSTPRTMTRP